MNKKSLAVSLILFFVAAGAVFADTGMVLKGILYRPTGTVEVSRIAPYLTMKRGDSYPDEGAVATLVLDTEKLLNEVLPEYSPRVSYYLKPRSDGKPMDLYIVIVLDARTEIQDIFPTKPTGNFISSGRSDVPVLAGSMSPVLGPRPLLDAPVYAQEGKVPFFDTDLFGGYDDGTIFGGFHLAGGASFQDSSEIGFFALGNVFGEYDRADGSGGKLIAWSTTFGFYGHGSFPWALVSNLVCEGVNGYMPYGTTAAGTVRTLADLGGLGVLKASGDVGLVYGVIGSSDESPDVFVRASLSLDNREYLGPLSQGIAARIAAECGVDTGIAEPYGTGSLVMEASWRYKSYAGLLARGGLLWSSSEYDAWTGHIRILKSGSVKGDLGVIASVEVPVLFARGVLLNSQNLAVDFFLRPFFDAALVRTNPSSQLFSGNNLYASAGGELSMTLDRFRKSVLRISAGSDISGLLRGDPGYAMDFVVRAALCVAL